MTPQRFSRDGASINNLRSPSASSPFPRPRRPPSARESIDGEGGRSIRKNSAFSPAYPSFFATTRKQSSSRHSPRRFSVISLRSPLHSGAGGSERAKSASQLLEFDKYEPLDGLPCNFRFPTAATFSTRAELWTNFSVAPQPRSLSPHLFSARTSRCSSSLTHTPEARGCRGVFPSTLYTKNPSSPVLDDAYEAHETRPNGARRSSFFHTAANPLVNDVSDRGSR